MMFPLPDSLSLPPWLPSAAWLLLILLSHQQQHLIWEAYVLPTPGLLSWWHWPWWEGKGCPESEVLGLMPWASRTGLLAFWTGTSVFLTYTDPKWWDFCNELIPNTQGLKDTVFTFLNPTKADSKPLVSMIDENPSVSSLPLLPCSHGLLWCWSQGGPGSSVYWLKVLFVQACEVRLLTPESVLSAFTSQGTLVTICIWYPATWGPPQPDLDALCAFSKHWWGAFLC